MGLFGNSPSGKIDPKNIQDVLAAFHGQGPLAVSSGANFPLSGGGGPTTFTPSPMPNIPFMPMPQVGPQAIPRGGNLGLPPTPGMPATPMPQRQIAVDPGSVGPPVGDPGNAMPSYAAVPGQTPSFNQAPGTTSMVSAGRAFDPRMFNLGMGLMKRGGNSSLASIASMLPQIMAMRGK